jgi:hypothetical protein
LFVITALMGMRQSFVSPGTLERGWFPSMATGEPLYCRFPITSIAAVIVLGGWQALLSQAW